MSKNHYKSSQLMLLLLTLCVLCVVFYLQYYERLQPCSLCVMQRCCAGIFVILTILNLCLDSRRWALRLTLLQILTMGLGSLFALRQLWLQALPPGEIAACLPDFSMMIRYFPWQVVLKTMFWGSSTCGEVTWIFWGLSMAAWSLFYFLLNGCFCLWLWICILI